MPEHLPADGVWPVRPFDPVAAERRLLEAVAASRVRWWHRFTDPAVEAFWCVAQVVQGAVARRHGGYVATSWPSDPWVTATDHERLTVTHAIRLAAGPLVFVCGVATGWRIARHQ